MHNILLLGYGEMGPYALEGLSEKFKLQGVVLPPEETRFYTKASERIKDQAHQKNIQVFKDKGLKGLHALIESTSPEAVVICSYDKIVPVATLELCPFINIHHGDLPRYRGRANLNWAIINGREDIGITVHKVIPDLDAGGIYHQWKIPISSEDYISDLYKKVNEKILKELPLLIEEILQGEKTPVPQKGNPTYCCTRLPEDGEINWRDSAEKIRNLIRGISKPFSGACTTLYEREKKEHFAIWRADLPCQPRKYEGNMPGRVGRILRGQGIEVLTGTSPLIVTEVFFQGKDCRADEVIKSTSVTLR